MAPVMPRNYIIMEVKGNLMKAERQVMLKKFCAPHFKRIAHVVMGEPIEEYKAKAQAQKLAELQAKATQEWKTNKLVREKKKALELRHKQMLEEKKKAEGKDDETDRTCTGPLGKESGQLMHQWYGRQWDKSVVNGLECG